MDRDTQEACRKGRLEAMRGALFGVNPAFYTALHTCWVSIEGRGQLARAACPRNLNPDSSMYSSE